MGWRTSSGMYPDWVISVMSPNVPLLNTFYLGWKNVFSNAKLETANTHHTNTLSFLKSNYFWQPNVYQTATFGEP